MSLKAFVNTCKKTKRLLDTAKDQDKQFNSEFNENDYEWEFGKHVIEDLHMNYWSSHSDEPFAHMGIHIRVNNDDPDIIKLWRNVV